MPEITVKTKPAVVESITLTLSVDEALYLYEALRLTGPGDEGPYAEGGDPIWLVLSGVLENADITKDTENWVKVL